MGSGREGSQSIAAYFEALFGDIGGMHQDMCDFGRRAFGALSRLGRAYVNVDEVELGQLFTTVA